jgi:DNA-binding transcriptional LysR family regulator
MAKTFDWDGRIGRRVRLRDLHILFAVVQHGSMAKAGAHLGMSQSAVSQAIAALEHALDVPLFDRTPRGVELTIYGAALMRRGQAAFDELRLGVKDIEFLTNPEVGELWVGGSEATSAGLLPPVIERFSRRYPKVGMNIIQNVTHHVGFTALHERRVDLVLTHVTKAFEGDLAEQLQAEVLFYDRICLVAAKQSRWARLRKINLADLADAVPISPPSDTGARRSFPRCWIADATGRDHALSCLAQHVKSERPLHFGGAGFNSPAKCRPLSFERTAARIADGTLAMLARYIEKSDLESAGRALHRIRA